ncbi:hypothetical protein OH77DRAFT_1431214 [Trametes cingulata]|nr:hypothetical protein OH77DRAFT_1431214 [Trametes cingulata]
MPTKPSKRVYFPPGSQTFGRSEPPTAVLPPSLYCGHCYKLQWELRPLKLRRCTGCGLVTYCSKECQKAAWNRHRASCRGQKTLDSAALAQISEGSAVKQWVEKIHHYAVISLAGGLVRMHPGITPDSFTSPNHALLFRLEACADNNPAKRFRPVTAPCIVERAHLGELAKEWAKWDAECRDTAVFVRRFAPDSVDCFAGMLPAIFIVVNTGLVMFHHVAVYGLPHMRDPLEPSSRVMIQDVVDMCVESLQCGLVFHCSEDQTQDLPDVGTYVRKGREWEWEPLANWNWDEFVATVTRTDPQAPRMRPRPSWCRFHDELS